MINSTIIRAHQHSAGALYKEHNMIERLFNKLMHFRRIATRYDKTASAFL